MTPEQWANAWILLAAYAFPVWILFPVFRNERATYLQAVKAIHILWLPVLFMCMAAADILTRAGK